MEKRQKNILVWLITWSALLLVILYSPIGSPDLYTTKKYFTPNQGVQFTGVEIENAPGLKNRVGNYQAPSVPDFNSSGLSDIASYSVSVSEHSFNPSSEANPTQAYNPTNSNQKNGNSDGFSFGSGASMSTYIGKSTKQNDNPPSTGFMALTTDLNGLSANSPFQGVNEYLPGSGATDPGFNDPVGDPIPVGDGWGLFILFGACYILLKKVIIKKQIATTD